MGAKGTDAGCEGIRRGIETARRQFDGTQPSSGKRSGDKATIAIAGAAKGCDRRLRVHEKPGGTLRSTRREREAAILREISSGNFPDFLRKFKTVPIAGPMKGGGKEVTATIEVMPDYIAIGSDSDFVRIPMTPQTAQQIADQFGCTLPTRKMVDAIDRVAEVRLAPHPMTVDREAVATFAEHNAIIEKQRGDKPLGLLVIGSKKDIVLTPRIFEKPQRLAIYGWRQLNGQPIQPLTIVHWNRLRRLQPRRAACATTWSWAEPLSLTPATGLSVWRAWRAAETGPSARGRGDRVGCSARAQPRGLPASDGRDQRLLRHVPRAPSRQPVPLRQRKKRS